MNKKLFCFVVLTTLCTAGVLVQLVVQYSRHRDRGSSRTGYLDNAANFLTDGRKFRVIGKNTGNEMSFTQNGISTLPEKRQVNTTVVADNQKRRKLAVKKFCRRHSKKRYKKINSHVLISHKMKAVYCAVGKVASSSWVSLLKRAAGDHSRGRHSKNLPRLVSIVRRIENYFRFMFVRHPFDRLLSAYRSKFLRKSDYLFKLVPKIVQLYRKKPLPANSTLAKTITFEEFISYITDRRSQPLTDFHWRPQTSICPPCQLSYDFIGHYETLYDDVNYVLNKLRVNTKLTFQRRRPIELLSERHQRIAEAFANVPRAQRARLKQIYQWDFDAFGYDPHVI